jgi:hypothetical protein
MKSNATRTALALGATVLLICATSFPAYSKANRRHDCKPEKDFGKHRCDLCYNGQTLLELSLKYKNLYPGENPQGPFLEGLGFERRYFALRGGSGGTLEVRSACSSDPRLAPKMDVDLDCPSTTPGRCIAKVTSSDLSDDVPQNSICGVSVASGSTVKVGVTRVDGHWNDQGVYDPDASTFTLSCNFDVPGHDSGQDPLLNGAVAKCSNERDKSLGFGYPLSMNSSSNQESFLACIRSLRADYCGDGRTGTKVGTIIELYDRNDPSAKPPPPHYSSCCDTKLCLEATWDKDGAICISHTRWQKDCDAVALNCEHVSGRQSVFDETGVGQHCRIDVPQTPKEMIVTRSQRHDANGKAIQCKKGDPDPTKNDADPDCKNPRVCPP